jgi:NAD-dependent SIR2 family protein deacetylase
MDMGFEEIMKKRPHVVILGAGASCAAIPNGDKNGKKISAMNGFIEKLGLSELLSKITLSTDSNNLEDIYMELDGRSNREKDCEEVKSELEQKIFKYMTEYEIPDSPTIYDNLILSLTEKDLIATFNWDPLLVQAYCRVMQYTKNLPFLVYLHGNVAVGYCEQDNAIGNIGGRCKCGKLLRPLKLLYPIKKKNYNDNIAIAKSWKELQNNLHRAYMVTIFGYSAPQSDIEAIAKLKSAWGTADKRNLEEIEIIDIREEDEVIESWKDFIHTHHYSYHTDFFTSTLGKFPRRSCEATFDRLMNCRFLDGSKGFTKGMTFDDIVNKIAPLLDEEEEKKLTGEMLSKLY